MHGADGGNTLIVSAIVSEILDRNNINLKLHY